MTCLIVDLYTHVDIMWPVPARLMVRGIYTVAVTSLVVSTQKPRTARAR